MNRIENRSQTLALPWLWDSILSRKNCLNIPCENPIYQAVDPKHSNYFPERIIRHIGTFIIFTYVSFLSNTLFIFQYNYITLRILHCYHFCLPLSITLLQFTPTADCSYSAITLHPIPNATLFNKLWNNFSIKTMFFW